MDKICKNCACCDVCIHYNPYRAKDCKLWQPRVPSMWISVDDERKPVDRKRYFIAYVFGDSDIHFYGEAMYHAYEGNGLVERPHFSNEGVEGLRVTHWMEIPSLPQSQKGG